jgi:uncharacterized protein (TIGR02391 family)
VNVPSQAFIPPPAEAIELPVDELALDLLRLIVHEDQGHLLTRGNAGNPGHWTHHSDPSPDLMFLEAISEAYDWLLHQGLVARRPGEESGWCYVTRRGLTALAESEPLQRLRAEQRITARMHLAIRQEAREQVLHGRWDNAVLVGLREVEIRVREMSDLDGHGVDLMGAAFSPKMGPLCDPSASKGEQDGMVALFRGAFGLFRNPPGHRRVEYPDPDYASEVLGLADLLYRILDQVEDRLRASPESSVRD